MLVGRRGRSPIRKGNRYAEDKQSFSTLLRRCGRSTIERRQSLRPLSSRGRSILFPPRCTGVGGRTDGNEPSLPPHFPTFETERWRTNLFAERGVVGKCHFIMPKKNSQPERRRRKSARRADGVGVSHSLSMRKVSGSIPDRSRGCAFSRLGSATPTHKEGGTIYYHPSSPWPPGPTHVCIPALPCLSIQRLGNVLLKRRADR